jgi:hypothetical protein
MWGRGTHGCLGLYRRRDPQKLETKPRAGRMRHQIYEQFYVCVSVRFWPVVASREAQQTTQYSRRWWPVEIGQKPTGGSCLTSSR